VGLELFGLFTDTDASVIEISPHAGYRHLAAGEAPPADQGRDLLRVLVEEFDHFKEVADPEISRRRIS
jgi:hypothetical protein